jgi:hypothetical protein
MPRGKKEPAEQVIPYAASVEVEADEAKPTSAAKPQPSTRRPRCRSLWNNDGSPRFVSAPDSHSRLLRIPNLCACCLFHGFSRCS